MGIKRYVAMTNREAMAQVRRDLGDDAVILSNKRIVGGRVEIVAAAPAAMDALVEDARISRSAAAAPRGPLRHESFQE
jgi:flagellar biosynthesis protein FlhF